MSTCIYICGKMKPMNSTLCHQRWSDVHFVMTRNAWVSQVMVCINLHNYSLRENIVQRQVELLNANRRMCLGQIWGFSLSWISAEQQNSTEKNGASDVVFNFVKLQTLVILTKHYHWWQDRNIVCTKVQRTRRIWMTIDRILYQKWK